MPRLPNYDPEGSADNLADRLQDSEDARLNPEYDLVGRDEEEDDLSPMSPTMPKMSQRPEGRKLTNNEAAMKMIQERRIKKLQGRSILNKAPKRRS